jgi:hypothetical protein
LLGRCDGFSVATLKAQAPIVSLRLYQMWVLGGAFGPHISHSQGRRMAGRRCQAAGFTRPMPRSSTSLQNIPTCRPCVSTRRGAPPARRHNHQGECMRIFGVRGDSGSQRGLKKRSYPSPSGPLRRIFQDDSMGLESVANAVRFLPVFGFAGFQTLFDLFFDGRCT